MGCQALRVSFFFEGTDEQFLCLEVLNWETFEFLDFEEMSKGWREILVAFAYLRKDQENELVWTYY